MKLTGTDGHEPAPRPGTARRPGGQPADLRNAAHYPVTARCMTCGRPIRCDRWFRGGWHHVDDGPGGRSGGAGGW
jgi:hypothetical protein